MFLKSLAWSLPGLAVLTVVMLIAMSSNSLSGYGASWLMVEKIMNQDGGAFDGTGGILFIWPWWQILLAAVLVYGLCLFAGRGHLRREVKQ